MTCTLEIIASFHVLHKFYTFYIYKSGFLRTINPGDIKVAGVIETFS